MNPKKKVKNDLSAYRIYGLPLVVLMGLIALAGIVLAVALKFFF
ncbi:MAG: hypothetical protein ACD_60C00137G0008 [uncultured bacterium]|nr:MAG: hypothetical protein ACD_60C00137G0008 [uncultured bacterium]